MDTPLWAEAEPDAGWGPPVQISTDGASTVARIAATKAGLARAVWNTLRLGGAAADGTWSAPRIVSGRDAADLLLLVNDQGGNRIIWGDGFRNLFYLPVPP